MLKSGALRAPFSIFGMAIFRTANMPIDIGNWDSSALTLQETSLSPVQGRGPGAAGNRICTIGQKGIFDCVKRTALCPDELRGRPRFYHHGLSMWPFNDLASRHRVVVRISPGTPLLRGATLDT